jgi:ferrochelatase
MVKRGIVLVNLGSPDSTEVKDVRRYLDEFLMDERVIDKPYILRALLVKGIIVPFRSPKSAAAYKSIWWKEGSPLIVLSEQLRDAVQNNFDIPVEIAMRYGNPSPKEAYDKLTQRMPGLEEVIMVPLYPHYAMSSYETAVVYMEEIHKKYNYPFKLKTIQPFYNKTDYIHALAESIRPYTRDNNYDKILFSYHGIPERHVTKCDSTKNHCLKLNDCCHVASTAHATCYRHQTIITTELTSAALGLPKEKVEQTFQSRLGRDQWLLPYTAKRLTELPNEGVKNYWLPVLLLLVIALKHLKKWRKKGKKYFCMQVAKALH